MMMEPLHQRPNGHGDAVSYLLGALEPDAREVFERHVLTCAECQQEIAQFQLVADDLALGVAQVEPPPQLRQRLLTRAALTYTEEIEPSPAHAVPLPFPRVTGSPGPVLAASPNQPASAWRWLRVPERFALPLAAASMVVALASGGVAIASQRQLREVSETADYASAQLSETLSIVYQPNMIAKTLTGGDGAPMARGRMIMVPDRTKAVVIAYDLPRLKREETYQCWLTSQEESRVDGGVFRSDESGKAYWVLRAPEMLMRYRWMSVTKEPSRGSPAPAGPRVLGGQI